MHVSNAPMMKKKHDSIASISLDLDNKWSYLKTYGDESWKSYPSYFEMFIPLFLEILNDLKLNITFFIVGQDAIMKKNIPYLKQITEHGHEVGNHSFSHEPWSFDLSRHIIEKEVRDAEKAIIEATAMKPVGFRGPGFTWNSCLFEVLKSANYMFDASVLPTYLGPVARLYYFRKSNLTAKNKKRRKLLFGELSNGFNPIKPYFWRLPTEELLMEIPVTTIPILKLPFHLSYLIYISQYSMKLMRIYLRLAIALCKLTSVSPSFLLHPLDILGCDQINDLSFFPGMRLESMRKIEIFKEVIFLLSENFELVNLSQHAATLSITDNPKIIEA